QNLLRPQFRPEHARLFTSRADDGFAARFHHARSNEKPPFAKGSVLHPANVVQEIAQFFFNSLGVGFANTLLSGLGNQFFYSVFQQPLGPAALMGFALRMLFA